LTYSELISSFLILFFVFIFDRPNLRQKSLFLGGDFVLFFLLFFMFFFLVLLDKIFNLFLVNRIGEILFAKLNVHLVEFDRVKLVHSINVLHIVKLHELHGFFRHLILISRFFSKDRIKRTQRCLCYLITSVRILGFGQNLWLQILSWNSFGKLLLGLLW